MVIEFKHKPKSDEIVLINREREIHVPLLEKKSLILLASWKLVFKFFMWLEGDYLFCNKYDLLRAIKCFSHLLSIPFSGAIWGSSSRKLWGFTIP